MKAVDITLLFQAFNFFIAYWVLRSYVFYPAMKILKVQESTEKSLRLSIDKQRAENQKAVDHKSSAWIEIKQSLSSLIPSFKIKDRSELVGRNMDSLKAEAEEHLSAKQQENVKKILNKALLDVKR